MIQPIQDGASKHKFNIRNARPVYQSELGCVQQFTTDELPILKNLPLQRIELEPGAILEPKWFTNCNALGYCIEGKVLVSILDSASQMAAFDLTPGQMFHVDSGALFHVENIANEKVVILLSMRHEHPKDFTLSSSAGAFTDAVLGNTFDFDASIFKKCERSTKPKAIVKREGDAVVPANAHWPNPHRFTIEEMQAPTYAAGVGSAKKARSQYWKILKNVAMYSLRVEEDGMREVHWHPDTVEVGCIHQGRARISIMDPDGSVDTFTLGPGDVCFIPASYPHQIEVIGDKVSGKGPQSLGDRPKRLESCHEMTGFGPLSLYACQDVGFRQAGAVFSREVLAAAFGISKNALPEFPYEMEDPLLVVRKNAVDPVV